MAGEPRDSVGLYAFIINGMLAMFPGSKGKSMLSAEVTVVKPSRRREERLPADIRARYGASGNPERALCRIIDVSKHGARLEVYCDLPLATSITLKLPNSEALGARVVWSKDFEAGCRFNEPLSDDELEFIFRKGNA